MSLLHAFSPLSLLGNLDKERYLISKSYDVNAASQQWPVASSFAEVKQKVKQNVGEGIIVCIDTTLMLIPIWVITKFLCDW